MPSIMLIRAVLLNTGGRRSYRASKHGTLQCVRVCAFNSSCTYLVVAAGRVKLTNAIL